MAGRSSSAPTGRNFAAGMSGGIAYVLDDDGRLPERSSIRSPRSTSSRSTRTTSSIIQNMLRKHFDYTRSRRADDVLRKWDTYAPKFVKVFPREYRAALASSAEANRSRVDPPIVQAARSEPLRPSRRASAEADHPWPSPPDFSRPGDKGVRYRPVEERIRDFKQVMLPMPRRRAADTGLALHGLRNSVLHESQQSGAAAARSATSFPTGTISSIGTSGRTRSRDSTRRTTSRSSPARSVPRPCEAGCVLGINDDPVTIKNIEFKIVSHAWEHGLHQARRRREAHGAVRGRRRLGSGWALGRTAARSSGP